jgi:hypothetical protein
MFDREPNRYEELKKTDEQRRAEEQERERKAQQQKQSDRPNIIDDTEAKMTAFRLEQAEKVKAGKITQADAIHNERQYENELANSIKRDGASSPSATPDRQEFDTKRFMTDRDYRELMTAQRRAEQERAEQGRIKGAENENGPTRPVTGGGRKY